MTRIVIPRTSSQASRQRPNSPPDSAEHPVSRAHDNPENSATTSLRSSSEDRGLGLRRSGSRGPDVAEHSLNVPPAAVGHSNVESQSGRSEFLGRAQPSLRLCNRQGVPVTVGPTPTSEGHASLDRLVNQGIARDSSDDWLSLEGLPSKGQGGSRPASPGTGSPKGAGYNSEDERSGPASLDPRDEEAREQQFLNNLKLAKNLEMHGMLPDGNCLFRAVADQIYGDSELHGNTRHMCIDYMEANRDHYSQFVTENFTAYCKRKRKDQEYGNNLEMQALAEMYNRPIEVYCYGTEPINIFHGSYASDNPPIRLSYHRGNHYNSLVDPSNVSVGAGLGLAHLQGRDVDSAKVKAVLKEREDEQVEKALLAEGRWLSDLALTEEEMEAAILQSSRAEAVANTARRKGSKDMSCMSPDFGSAGVGPSSSSSKFEAARSSSGRARGGQVGGSMESKDFSTNVRMLLSMGFGYVEATEAVSIFGDDFDSLLCYLLEQDSTGGKLKGKALA